MKVKIILSALIFASCLFAQSPQNMSYQAIIRDNSNNLIKSTMIGMRVSILHGSSTGTAVYVETQKPKSDINGLVTINIGNGNVVSGSFSTINWSSGPYFIKTETDPLGATNYTIVGTSQLMSVPYAFYASSTGKVSGSVSVVDYGAVPSTDWVHAIDNSAAFQAAIDSNPGKSIIIPAGIYLFNSPVIVRKSVELIGEGRNNTIIQPTKCNGFVITSSNVAIKNIFIYGTGHEGIYLQSVRNTLLENIKLQNVTYAIELFNSWNTKIDKVDILINEKQSPKVAQGIRLTGQSVNTQVSNCHIEATDFGISIIKGTPRSEGLIISNSFIGLAQSGIYCESILGLNVTNCIIDLITGYALWVKNSRAMLFSNNWIQTQSSATKAQAIQLEAVDNSHITNNYLSCLNGVRGISVLSYSNSNTIIGNTIDIYYTKNGWNVFFDGTTQKNLVSGNILNRKSGSTFIYNPVKSNVISGNITL